MRFISQLMHSAKVQGKSFPERMSIDEFLRHFHLLRENGGKDDNGREEDGREAVRALLEKEGIGEQRYRLGLSQVLMRRDTLDELEDMRHACVVRKLIALQAVCRYNLAQTHLRRMRNGKCQKRKSVYEEAEEPK